MADKRGIRRMGPADPRSGFRSGVHPLDDYFRRHALTNDQLDVGRVYVLESSDADLDAGLPPVLGFYTLSMASITSQEAATALQKRLPRYPMPVALIGRLAVDERARGQRLGESLLIDALKRVVDAADLVACLGIVVDAKNDNAEHFYKRYDFIVVDETSWPHRMFLPIDVARAAFEGDES